MYYYGVESMCDLSALQIVLIEQLSEHELGGFETFIHSSTEILM